MTPLVEVQTTGLAAAGLPGGTFAPAARKPVAVRRSTFTWSPRCMGAMPWVDASVHATPSWLVQTALGPRAAHWPWPPATSVAGCPGAGLPPPAACSVPSFQVLPPSVDTKNCARLIRAPA